jgi:hypothetical protein
MLLRRTSVIIGRWPLWVAISAVLALMTTVPSDAAGPWSHAVGGGAALDPLDPLSTTNHFAFSALQGPSACRGGFGSWGHARFDLPEAIVLGPVSCVNVDPDGKHAVFVVQNQNGTNTSTVTSLRVYVEDNGNPAGAPVDMIDWQMFPQLASPGQPQCDTTLPPVLPLSKLVTKGNIVVEWEPGACPPA